MNACALRRPRLERPSHDGAAAAPSSRSPRPRVASHRPPYLPARDSPAVMADSRAMGVEYMYLVFARERYWQIRVNGVTHRADGEGEPAVSTFFEKHVWPELREQKEEAKAVWDRQLDTVRDSATVATFTRKEGSLGSRVNVEVSVITFADGSTVECTPAKVSSELRKRCALQNGKRPEIHRAESFQSWKQESRAVAVEFRGWGGTAYLPDGATERFSEDLGDWVYGAPLAGITRALNHFADEGWAVVSSSEDKGLYQGADARDESYPSRIRYLLGRSSA